MLALAYAVSLCITYAPGARAFQRLVNIILLVMTLITATIAIAASRLPAHHWVHNRAPRWLLLLLAAIGFAELLAIVG